MCYLYYSNIANIKLSFYETYTQSLPFPGQYLQYLKLILSKFEENK